MGAGGMAGDGEAVEVEHQRGWQLVEAAPLQLVHWTTTFFTRVLAVGKGVSRRQYPRPHAHTQPQPQPQQHSDSDSDSQQQPQPTTATTATHQQRFFCDETLQRLVERGVVLNLDAHRHKRLGEGGHVRAATGRGTARATPAINQLAAKRGLVQRGEQSHLHANT